MDLIHKYCVEFEIDMLYAHKNPDYKEHVYNGALLKLGYQIAKFIEQNSDKNISVKIVTSEIRIDAPLKCDMRRCRKEAMFYDNAVPTINFYK